MTGRLESHVSIITGAGSGLGAETARRFGAEGASVLCVDINGDAASTVADEIVATGGAAVGLEVDVADVDATEEMAALALRTWGRIDSMYANAAISPPESALSCTPDVWARVIAVNLTGPWLCARAVLPAMIEARSGSLIFQTSGAGILGVPGTCPYAASKAGVIGLNRQIAAEYGPYGIRANAIAPGSIWTPLNQRTYEERTRLGQYESVEAGVRQSTERLPLKRFGRPEDNASLALFLASDESVWITGTVIPLDGGLTSSAGLVTPSRVE